MKNFFLLNNFFAKFSVATGLVLVPFGLATAAEAVVKSVPPTNTTSMLQVTVGLVAVLALMIGIARLLKRYGPVKTQSASAIKIIGGVTVGQREKVLVIEVADQWIVVGVATGSVTALATLPKHEQSIATELAVAPEMNNFPAWLKQIIDRRSNHGDRN